MSSNRGPATLPSLCLDKNMWITGKKCTSFDLVTSCIARNVHPQPSTSSGMAPSTNCLSFYSSIPALESLLFHSDLDIAFYEWMKLPSPILPILRIFSLQPSISINLLAALLSLHADVIPIIAMVESRLAGGVLKSVNVGRLVVKILGDGAKRRLKALNASSHVKVEIEELSMKRIGSNFSRHRYH